jgi:hypothetical protein
MSTLQDRFNEDGRDDWDVVLSCVSGLLRDAGTVGRTDRQLAAVLSQGVPTIRAAIADLCGSKSAHWSVRGENLVAWAGPITALRRRGPSPFHMLSNESLTNHKT